MMLEKYSYKVAGVLYKVCVRSKGWPRMPIMLSLCLIFFYKLIRMPENESNSLSRKLSKFGSIRYKHRYR